MPQAKLPLNVVIVGGGIAGLTAATFLAQDGHSVTVLERQSSDFQSRGSGGICLFQNSKLLYDERGFIERILAISDSGNVIHNVSYTGTLIAAQKTPHTQSFVHRADFLRLLRDLAVEQKVRILYNIQLESVDDRLNGPLVTLADSTEIEADIVLAADGINSFVRQQLFPDARPSLTSSVVLLVDVPEEVMKQNDANSELWNEPPYHHILGPERSIVCWTMRRRDPMIYHLQFCDHKYNGDQTYGENDDRSPLVSSIGDMGGFRERWQDFEPRIQHILNNVQSYRRWKIAEVPELASYCSTHNGFVLVGDAAHGVPPFAGQGANMAVEDAGALATLLSSITSKSQIPKALKVYESVRMPRIAGLRDIIRTNIATFGAADKETQQKRDTNLNANLNVILNGESQLQPTTNWREYGTKERIAWLVAYNTSAATREAWALKASEHQH